MGDFDIREEILFVNMCVVRMVPKEKTYIMKKLVKKITVFIFALILITNGDSLSIYAQASSPYLYRRSWGDESSNIFPTDIAISPDGTKVYVADSKYHRVVIINRLDRTTRSFGKLGFYDGKLTSPNGIAVDQQGNLYVADINQCLIQKFTANGEYLMQFGNPVSECYQVAGVAVSKLGDVYAVSCNLFTCGHNVIRRYKADGTLLAEWESPVMGHSFMMPNAIAVDGNGNVYITDTLEDRILKFSQDGIFLIEFGSQGQNPGQFWRPYGIAVDSSGFVYVADTNNHRIQKFTSGGAYISSFGVVGSENGNFSYPRGVDVDSNGNIYVADTSNARVQKFNSSFTYLTSWGDTSLAPGYFGEAEGVSLDQNGFIYIADTNNSRIVKYNPDGTFITTWGSKGSAPGQFDRPTALVVDKTNGYLFVADQYNSRIQKLSLNGIYASSWGIGGGLVSGIALDNSGNIYVADRSNGKIIKYSPGGALLNQWLVQTMWGSVLDIPSRIAVDEYNNIFVTLQNTGKVEKYSSAGAFITSWAVLYPGEVATHAIRGIATNHAGQVFITDLRDHKIFVYDLNGQLQYSIGNIGTGPDGFYQPSGLAFDSNSNLFVADSGNSRIVELSKSLPLDPQSGPVINGDFEAMSPLSSWSYGGNLPINAQFNAVQQDHSLQLGQVVVQTEQGEGRAWAYQTIFVDPAWDHPFLNFRYDMFVNDILDYSDFLVEIQDGTGHNHLATVVRDGYIPVFPGTPPAAGIEVGWKSVAYNLSSYKGQYIRIVFSNRNLWPISWGIWTQVDDVRVVDIGYNYIFMPIVIR